MQYWSTDDRKGKLENYICIGRHHSPRIVTLEEWPQSIVLAVSLCLHVVKFSRKSKDDGSGDPQTGTKRLVASPKRPDPPQHQTKKSQERCRSEVFRRSVIRC